MYTVFVKIEKLKIFRENTDLLDRQANVHGL